MRNAGCEVQDARSGMSYRDLEIWKLAREIAIAVHRMTLQNLPKFEMYEEASQIRRSAKSISANIVEGYGRRRTSRSSFGFLYSLMLPAMKPLSICKYSLKRGP